MSHACEKVLTSRLDKSPFSLNDLMIGNLAPIDLHSVAADCQSMVLLSKTPQAISSLSLVYFAVVHKARKSKSGHHINSLKIIELLLCSLKKYEISGLIHKTHIDLTNHIPT